jgi:protein tyrosine phosphatase
MPVYKVTERGINKCHPYLPVSSSYPLRVEPPEPDSGKKPITIWLLDSEQPSLGHPWRRHKLALAAGPENTPSANWIEVTHFEYLGWPDFGVPDDPTDLVRLIDQVQVANDNAGGEQRPILAHCSAGVGRTGTLITIASLLELVRRGVTPQGTPDPVFATVDRLRESRAMFVQMPEQLATVYAALSDQWLVAAAAAR